MRTGRYKARGSDNADKIHFELEMEINCSLKRICLLYELLIKLIMTAVSVSWNPQLCFSNSDNFVTDYKWTDYMKQDGVKQV